MRDFKYCIWLCPNDNHPWNTYTRGFNPHVSIYTKLSKKEALEKFDTVTQASLGLRVKLINELRKGDSLRNRIEPFYSIYQKVDTIDTVSWWPKRAHLSLAYQYDKPFTQKEVSTISEKIQVRSATLTHAKIVKVTGHYSNWCNQIVADSQRTALVKISQTPPSRSIREWFKHKFKKDTKILYTSNKS